MTRHFKYYQSGANLDPDNEKGSKGKERMGEFFTIPVSSEDLSKLKKRTGGTGSLTRT